MVDLGPLNIDKPGAGLPLIDISQFVPNALPIPGPSRGASRPRLVANQPRAITGYQKKYAPGSEYSQLLAQYPEYATGALQALDASRASKGQAPLSVEQSQKALDTVVTGTPATPKPKKGLFNLPGNIISDVTDIVRSIPRVPAALAEEAMSITQIGEAIEAGKNPVHGLATAPLFRMAPGSFVVQQVAGGTPGELLRHPVYTALDVLPFAGKAAKAGTLGRTVAESARAIETGAFTPPTRQALQIQKMARRPIPAALTTRVVEGAPATPKLPAGYARTGFGELVDAVANTKAFRAAAKLTQQPRNAMFYINMANQRTSGIMKGTIPATNDLEALGRRAAKFVDDMDTNFPELTDGARMAEVYEKFQMGDFTGLAENELRAAEVIRGYTDDVATYLAAEGRNVMFGGELYDLQVGRRLEAAEAKVNEASRFTALREQISTGTANPQQLASDMLDTLAKQRAVATPPGTPGATNAGRTSQRVITTQHRGTVAAIRASGLDPQPLIDAFKARADDPALYTDALRATADGTLVLEPHALLPFDAITFRLGAVKDPRAKLLLDSIAAGNWKAVTKQIDDLFKRKGAPWMDETMRDSLRAYRDQSQLLSRDLAPYTPEALAKKLKTFERIKAKSIPSRFIPISEARAAKKYRDQLISVTDVDTAAKLIQTDLQSLPGFDPKVYHKIARETAMTWQSIRDIEGRDPIFLSNVSPNKAHQVLNPTAKVIPTTPSAFKARTLDMTPGVQNISVAMTNPVRELLSQQHIEFALKQISDDMGVSEKLLRDYYRNAAENRAAANPALTIEGHLQEIIKENYRVFDPAEHGYNWGSPYMKKLAADRPYIPISVYDTLQSLANPKSLLGGVFDPFTKLFRTSVVALSARTQIYNVVGNNVMLMLEQPGAMVRQFRTALKYRRAIKEGRLDEVPPRLLEVMGSQKQVLLDKLSPADIGVVNETVYGHLKGRMAQRLWGDAQAAKTPGKPITGRYGGKISGLVEKAYDLNGVFDDFTRMVAYSDAFEQAIKRGAGVEAAERAAVAQMRRTLQDWLGMVPFERSVMRSIFPFYGFMGHAMRFVMRYPFDHPIRAEVISKVALAELEDQQSLPNRFLSFMFVGGSGPIGERTAINMGPLNPFGDVANFATISGALGATNPLIQTALELVGVENGEAGLYPSLRYDSETGRLGIRNGNPLLALMENTIPQSALLTALLGVNAEYNDMARRDPAAASRFIASGLTLPILWRQFNVPQEQIKAELARQEGEQQVLTEALRSGDWSEAMNYPNLASYLDALDALSDEQIAPFRPLSPEAIQALPSTDTTYQSVQPLSELTKQSQVAASIPTVALPSAGISLSTQRSQGGI